MESDDTYGCLGIPSPEKMWRQRAALLAAELDEHLVDLRQMREKVAKLVIMNGKLAAERDRLKAELRDTAHKLSESRRQLSMAENTLAGFAMARDRAESYALSYAPPDGKS